MTIGTSVADATNACLQNLESCLAVERLAQEAWAETRLGDFNLWISGIGALAPGKASLDSRLGSRPEVQSVVTSLLVLLRSNVERCKELAASPTQRAIPSPSEGSESGESSPLEEDDEPPRAFSPWSDGSASDGSRPSDRQGGRTSPVGALEEAMRDVEEMLDQLGQLGLVTRRAGKRSRFVKADQRFCSEEHQMLERHLTSMLLMWSCSHPTSGAPVSGPLTEIQRRLIHTNMKRRNRFIYAQSHSLGLSPAHVNRVKSEATAATATIESPVAQHSSKYRDLADMNPKVGDDGVPQTRQTVTTASAISDSFAKDTLHAPPPTGTSTMLSTTVGSLEYPRPPRLKETARVFRCPCCCQTLPADMATPSRWKKHIAEDLCPYTCILPHCRQPDLLFDTKAEWLQHLQEGHSSSAYWVCSICNDATTFASEYSFIHHTRLNHHDSVPQEQVPLLADISRHSVPTEIRCCPFCNWPEGEEGETDMRTLLDHIARGVHAFSLRALPWADTNGQETDERIDFSCDKVQEWLSTSGLSNGPPYKEPPPREGRRLVHGHFEHNPYFAGSSNGSSSGGSKSSGSLGRKLENLRRETSLDFGHIDNSEDSLEVSADQSDNITTQPLDSIAEHSMEIPLYQRKDADSGSDTDESEIIVDDPGPDLYRDGQQGRPKGMYEKLNSGLWQNRSTDELETVGVILERLCRPPDNWQQHDGLRIPDENFNEIALIVAVEDREYSGEQTRRWAGRPRLYTVLRNIGHTELLDLFIKDRLTDYDLPFVDQTLPRFINDHIIRKNFCLHQRYVLTDARTLEQGGRHIHLRRDENLYFVHIRVLGGGAYGTVDSVMSLLSLRWYARKKFLRDSRKGGQYERYIIQQLEDIKSLSHRHLVRYIGSYTDPHYVVSIMSPLADMDLAAYLSVISGSTDNGAKALRYSFGCLAGAVQYLHEMQVIHPNLTAANVLVLHDRVFISDFVTVTRRATGNSRSTVPDNMFYMSPEGIEGARATAPSDMWSLGAIFLQIYSVILGHSPRALPDLIRHSSKMSEELPPACLNLDSAYKWMDKLVSDSVVVAPDVEPLNWIRALMQWEPTERLTADQLVENIQHASSTSAFFCKDCRLVYKGPRQQEQSDEREIESRTTEDTGIAQTPVQTLFEEVRDTHSEGEDMQSQGDLGEWPTSASESSMELEGDVSDGNSEDADSLSDGPQDSQKTANTSKDASSTAERIEQPDVHEKDREGLNAAVGSAEVPEKDTHHQLQTGLGDERRKKGKERVEAEPKDRPYSAFRPEISMGPTWESANSQATEARSSKRKTLYGARGLDSEAQYLERYCQEGKAAAVRHLLEQGCNPGTSQKPRPEPLFFAVRGGTSRHYKCLQALIEKNVDVNVQHRKSGKTALHFAVKAPDFKGHTNMVRDLVNAGANPNIADNKGYFPIHLIFKAGSPGGLEKFRLDALACILKSDINGGADVNIPNPHRQYSPLHLAVGRSSPLAVGMLLHKGADVNAISSSGSTPLFVAARKWSRWWTSDKNTILELLLAAEGINLNHTAGPLKRTVLHWAVLRYSSDAVRLLLKAGADPSIADAEGRTAIDFATMMPVPWKRQESIKIRELFQQVADRELFQKIADRLALLAQDRLV